MIGFGCSIAGQPTKTVVEVTELLSQGKYRQFSELLKTGNAGEKFLAVVSLEQLSRLGQNELSDNEKILIENIKASHDKVSVCAGCTYFDNVPLRKMLSTENFLGSGSWIKEILEVQ